MKRFGCLTRVRPALLIAGAGLSLFSTLLGMRAVLAFDHTPGAVRSIAEKWPAASTIGRSGTRPELLVFVHPFCACTTATIDELSKVSARQKSGAKLPEITVVFFRPLDSQWPANSMWDKARTQLGSRAIWDDGGREAERFGALTSGYTLLYNPRGDLLFHGGVTGSRGHVGDNFGLDELLASLDSGLPANRPSAVFGCALKWPGPAEPEVSR